MCNTNERFRDMSFMSATGCEPCEPALPEAPSVRMHTLKGRKFCVGVKVEMPLKYKIPKQEFPPQEGWMSHREMLALKEKQQRVKDKTRVVFKSTDMKRKKAMADFMALPKLTGRDIRRYRYPCTFYLPLELQEDGFPLSATILQGFIHYNENMRMLAVKSSPFFEEPPLSEQPQLLRTIAEGLAKVEAAGQKEPPDRSQQIHTLLEMAFAFLPKGETMSWIVEKVLLVAIDMASDYPRDGYKSLALARFAYGCFLSNFHLYEPAVHELEKARNITMGKSWTIDFEYDKKYDLLYLEINDMFVRALLARARKVRPNNPMQSVRFCSRALRRVDDPIFAPLEAETLLELGLGYKDAGKYVMAKIAFLEYLRRHGESEYIAGICTAYLEGALCYSQLGDLEKAKEFLFCVIEISSNAGLIEMTAKAQMYIGESFLRMGFYKEASNCLIDSFKLFFKLRNRVQSDRLRFLAAISKGMEILPDIAQLLSASISDTTGIHLIQLLGWRIHRTPFWDVTDETAPTLPDESLYTQVPEDEDDFVTVGSNRIRMGEINNAFIDFKNKQDSEKRRWVRSIKKWEEEGVNIHDRKSLPGYGHEGAGYRKEYRPFGYEVFKDLEGDNLIHIDFQFSTDRRGSSSSESLVSDDEETAGTMGEQSTNSESSFLKKISFDDQSRDPEITHESSHVKFDLSEDSDDN